MFITTPKFLLDQGITATPFPESEVVSIAMLFEPFWFAKDNTFSSSSSCIFRA